MALPRATRASHCLPAFVCVNYSAAKQLQDWLRGPVCCCACPGCSLVYKRPPALFGYPLQRARAHQPPSPGLAPAGQCGTGQLPVPLQRGEAGAFSSIAGTAQGFAPAPCLVWRKLLRGEAVIDYRFGFGAPCAAARARGTVRCAAGEAHGCPLVSKRPPALFGCTVQRARAHQLPPAGLAPAGQCGTGRCTPWAE
jgi:hypothetical protein